METVTINSVKTTAVILAGGYGSRLGGFKNPYRCKPLIKDGYKNTLLSHTLRRIEQSGIVNQIIILGRNDVKAHLLSESLKCRTSVMFLDNRGYKTVRQALQVCQPHINSYLFWIICGHAPPSVKHLRKMYTLSQFENAQVVTCYEPPIKRYGVCLENDYTIANFVDTSLNNDFTSNLMLSVDSPYLLTRNIISMMIKDQFRNRFPFYFQQLLVSGWKYYGLKADFPREADSVAQLIETLSYVESNRF